MAKYEQNLYGNFDEILKSLETGIIRGSMSASFENGSDYDNGSVRCAVRVFERYSMMGGNRVSLNLTLIGSGDNSFLTAITSGGSQAVLFKLNTFGEEAFLEGVIDIVKGYCR
ncbi:MAG: DUF6054 family protein [Oscillospiraceae bacterium]